MSPDAAREMLDNVLCHLSEHFEAIQIHISWPEPAGTRCVHRGAGNFYARLAMAREFTDLNTAEDSSWMIAQQLNPPDDNWNGPVA